jgi:hypothetical protein
MMSTYIDFGGIRMPTVALRVPTILPGRPILPNGQCYILFERGPIKTRDIIAAKVRAELRKARSGGMITTSLPLLLPDGVQIGFGPLEEQLAIAQAWRAFTDGVFLLLFDGGPLVELDESVELTRQTALFFVHVPQAVVPEEKRYADAA